jgi:hypothetical protein
MAGRRVTSITSALAAGKAEADGRVERSLYMRAVGYSYDAEKIFCDKNGNVTKVPYREHVPPDVTAQIFWLKNRDRAHWRDAWHFDHTLGKYVISNRPMTEEQNGSPVHDREKSGPRGLLLVHVHPRAVSGACPEALRKQAGAAARLEE